MEAKIMEQLEEINTLIYSDENAKVIDKVKNKDIVIFLGNTRSGKSTIINYIIGTTLKATKVRKTIFTISKESPQCPGPAIGNSSVSETSVPSVWTSSKITSLIIDSPGFNDNRGNVQDIINAFYIKNIISSVNSLKIVIISDIRDLIYDNINQFINLMGAVHKMFPLGDDLNSSVVMVFNKDNEDLTNNDIAEVLRDKILNVPQIPVAKRSLINYLSQHPHNISIIKMPTTEGKIDKEIFGNLVEIIETSTSKLPKAIIASISPGISDNSKIFLLEASKYLSNYENFNQLMSKAMNDFNSELNMCSRYYMSSNQIPPLLNALERINYKVNQIINDSNSSTTAMLQKMSLIVPSVRELKDGSQIYKKLKFIAFADQFLNLSESGMFRNKIYNTATQMSNKIQNCRNNFITRLDTLMTQELEIEHQRQQELLRKKWEEQRRLLYWLEYERNLEFERQRRIQSSKEKCLIL